jgi:hypothetical protein
MKRADAETLALRALGFLASDGDGLVRMLTLSGLDLEDLRARAGDSELLAAVLDFLLTDDALPAGFTAAEGVAPETVHAARRALPGGAGPIPD